MKNGSNLLRKKELYRIDEAARVMGVHRATIYRRIQSGMIEAVRVGSSLRIKASELAEIAEEPAESAV